MRIAILFGPLCLSFRKSFDFDHIRDDPRGLSGSEQGFLRVAQELRAMGHEVDVCPHGAELRSWDGMRVLPRPEGRYDVAIAVNEPDILRGVDAGFRACLMWLNDVSFCRVGFEEHVDLFVSPSAPHLEQFMTNERWQRVEVTPEHPEGKARFEASAAAWAVVPLGADVERYVLRVCPDCGQPEGSCQARLDCEHAQDDEWVSAKVPGRVVYCSSPDRGLHHLLQEWPHIKRAVPHANLRIFYRLKEWIAGWDNVAHYPPIEPLRARALYIEEALRRMSGPEWGITVCDSVSRERIEREMAEAEVLAFPCDTTTWSEGFSCTTLEACAARACPVITDCDALGQLYGHIVPAVTRADWMVTTWQEAWRRNVIKCLTDAERRERINDRARKLAEEWTWKNTAAKLMAAIQERL